MWRCRSSRRYDSPGNGRSFQVLVAEPLERTVMFRLIWALSVRTRYFLRRYMPTNILLDALRTRRGLRWGIPAMLLAIPYLYAASICVQLIEGGGPDWLHLLVLLFIYNAMKFTIMGPVSLVLLLRAKVREHAEHRREHRAGHQLRVPA